MRSLHLHQYYCNYSKKPNKHADSTKAMYFIALDSTGMISEKWIIFRYDKSLPSSMKSIFLVILARNFKLLVRIAKQKTEEFMPGSGER